MNFHAGLGGFISFFVAEQQYLKVFMSDLAVKKVHKNDKILIG